MVFFFYILESICSQICKNRSVNFFFCKTWIKSSGYKTTLQVKLSCILSISFFF